MKTITSSSIMMNEDGENLEDINTSSLWKLLDDEGELQDDDGYNHLLLGERL